MTIRSMKEAAGVSLLAAVLAVGVVVPAFEASAQVQAVPREGMSFPDSVTQRVTIESIDPEERTVAFTAPDGRLVVIPAAPGVTNLASINDGSTANVTYSRVVTLLNLRQKGVGSKTERRDAMSPTQNPSEIQSGRFTLTVVAVNLPANTVSVIDGNGGAVQTYKANTIAKQDMLKKIKVGDVVIGTTTPLLLTSISPAN